MARIAREEKAREPGTVFYVGTYSIGKERCDCVCVCACMMLLGQR